MTAMEALGGRVASLAAGGRQLLALDEGGTTLLACAREAGASLESLEAALAQLRSLTSRERVRAELEIDQGFRLEDAACVALAVPADLDPAPHLGWLRRRLGRETELEVARCGEGLALAAAIARRTGFAPGRARYA